MKNKVLLILPKTGPSIIEPPFGFLALSHYLSINGYSTVIIDTRFENYKKSIKKLDLDNFIAAGLSVMTGPQIRHALKISKYLKKNTVLPVIWGGIHPTIIPEQTMNETSIDYLVRGYGENILPMLLDCINCKNSFSSIPNIAYRSSDGLMLTKRRDVALKLPLKYDWTKIDVNRYIQSNYRFGNKVLSMFTSNGCIHNCSFCYGEDFHSKNWRAQSFVEVLKDIDDLIKKYNIDAVYFHDDNFFIDKERALNIARGMKKRRLPFGLAMRADYASDDLIKELKKCGCCQIDWGTESGSQRILNLYNKNIRIDDIVNLAKLTAKYDIMAYTTIMIGHPEESIEDIFKTLDFADILININPKLTISDIKILTPYPGTKIFKDAIRLYGLKLPDSLIGWSDFYWNNSCLCPLGKLNNLLNTLSIISLFTFCSWRIKRQNKLFNCCINILHKLESYRWHNREFRLPIEIYIIKFIIKLINSFPYN